MGLQTWPHTNIRKQDVGTSKNYLSKTEIKELNRLTSILLDIFEDQMELGRLTTIKDAKKMLDDRLNDLGRTVLKDGGHIAAKAARLKAEKQYGIYSDARKLKGQLETEQSYQELAKKTKGLPRART